MRLKSVIVACAMVGLFMTTARAQVPPGAAMRIVYPYAAGGSADGLARLLAERLAERLSVSAIVENKAGASGRIGIKSVIQSKPDGTTLLFSPLGPAAIHPLVYPDLDFDPFQDLRPVSQVATFDIGLLVHPSTPARDVKTFTAWARAMPEKATFAIPGAGGLPHFFGVMFARAAAIDLRPVLYRGSAAAVGDLVAGHVPAALLPVAEGLELHKAGKAMFLATSGPSRSPFLADVPTFREAGYDIAGEGWFALFAPSGASDATVSQISTALREIMSEPATRQRTLALGLVPTGTTADDLSRIQKGDSERWAPAVKASGFKPSL